MQWKMSAIDKKKEWCSWWYKWNIKTTYYKIKCQVLVYQPGLPFFPGEIDVPCLLCIMGVCASQHLCSSWCVLTSPYHINREQFQITSNLGCDTASKKSGKHCFKTFGELQYIIFWYHQIIELKIIFCYFDKMCKCFPRSSIGSVM